MVGWWLGWCFVYFGSVPAGASKTTAAEMWFSAILLMLRRLKELLISFNLEHFWWKMNVFIIKHIWYFFLCPNYFCSNKQFFFGLSLTNWMILTSGEQILLLLCFCFVCRSLETGAHSTKTILFRCMINFLPWSNFKHLTKYASNHWWPVFFFHIKDTNVQRLCISCRMYFAGEIILCYIIWRILHYPFTTKRKRV